MDEFLASAETTKGYKLAEVLKMYEEARAREDVHECNNYLYSIGRLLIMAQVAEQVEVSFEDIEDFSIDDNTITIAYKVSWDETVSGGIKVSHADIKTRTFELKGEIRDTVRNMDNAEKGILKFNSKDYSDVDAVYSSYIKKALLSSSKIEVDEPNFIETLLGDKRANCIDNQLNQEKIDVFEGHNNKTKQPSLKYGYIYNGKDRGISLCDAIREKNMSKV